MSNFFKTKNKFLHSISFQVEHELGSKFGLMQVFDADGDGVEDKKQATGSTEKMRHGELSKVAKKDGKNERDPGVNYGADGKPMAAPAAAPAASSGSTTTPAGTVDYATSIATLNNELKELNELSKGMSAAQATNDASLIPALLTSKYLHVKQIDVQNIHAAIAEINQLISNKNNQLGQFTGAQTTIQTQTASATGAHAGATQVDSQFAHAKATVDSAITNKQATIGSAELNAGAQKFQAQYSALSQALQTAGTIEGQRIQALGSLEGIIVSHKEDYVVATRTKYLEQADQILITGGKETFQRRLVSKQARVHAEYEIDRATIEMQREAQAMIQAVQSKKEDILEAYKAEHGGKLIGKDGKEISPEQLISIVSQNMVAENVFKKYENKINPANVKTFNGFKMKGEKMTFFLNDQDDNNGKIHEGNLTTEVLKRELNNDGTYNIRVKYSNGTVQNIKNVDGSRLYAEEDGNTSGLNGKSYMNMKDAVYMRQQSSGDRADLFMAPYISSINNDKSLDEDQKELKINKMQTGAEALFGGDKLGKGILLLLLNGGFGAVFKAVKQMLKKNKGGGTHEDALPQVNAPDVDAHQPSQPQPAITPAPQLSAGAKELNEALKGNDFTLTVDEKGKLVKVFQSEGDVVKAVQELSVKAEAITGKKVAAAKLTELAHTISVDLGILPAGNASVTTSKKATETPTVLDDKTKELMRDIILN